ncbi:hypothetical protein X975_19875, partial [Stegodyphus mimosarum]
MSQCFRFYFEPVEKPIRAVLPSSVVVTVIFKMSKIPRWSDSQTMASFDAYASSEVLWNTSLAEYKDKNRRQKAYEDIINTLKFEGLGVPELKHKINNFRSTYLQELKKIANSKRSGTSGDNIYKPSIVWFQMADSFLRPHVAQRKSQHNLVLEANEGSYKGAATPEWEETTDCSELDTSLSYEMPDEHETAQPSGIGTSQAKKRKRTAVPSGIDSAIIKLQKVAEAAKCAREEHMFDAFGKSVAAQLKALPKRDALELQIEIQTLISKKLIEKEERELSVVTISPQLNENGTYEAIYVPHM